MRSTVCSSPLGLCTPAKPSLQRSPAKLPKPLARVATAVGSPRSPPVMDPANDAATRLQTAEAERDEALAQLAAMTAICKQQRYACQSCSSSGKACAGQHSFLLQGRTQGAGVRDSKTGFWGREGIGQDPQDEVSRAVLQWPCSGRRSMHSQSTVCPWLLQEDCENGRAACPLHLQVADENSEAHEQLQQHLLDG